MNNFGQLLAQGDIPMPDSAKVHEGGFNFAPQASTFAPDVDFLYFAILWVSVFFFVVIIGAMCYFVVKYRRIEGVPAQPSSSHNTALEIFWSVIPSIILVYFFYQGAVGFFDAKVATDDAEEIYVTASKWNWAFRYPDGDVSSELHLVANRPVKLVMESRDVLHSLFVSAFRLKMDIVPGRYTYLFARPNRDGQYRLACAEYCGEKHSRMRTLCQVHPTEAERKSKTQWLNGGHPYWENGERLYKIHCSGCHNINGQAATGPALDTIWGITETMTNGAKIVVDDNYVKKSLEEPNTDIVQGFGPVSKMNSFKGKFSADDINYIVAYLKYLKDPAKYGGTEPGPAAADVKEKKSADPAATGEAEKSPTETPELEPAATGDDKKEN